MERVAELEGVQGAEAEESTAGKWRLQLGSLGSVVAFVGGVSGRP